MVALTDMPRDLQRRYWVEGAFRHRTISRPTRPSSDRPRNSLAIAPLPYPDTATLINRVDAGGDHWYRDTARDLSLRDFVWWTRLQSARRVTQRAERYPTRDRVLERLLEEGIFDRLEGETRNTGEELSMAYSAAMTQRLLMRIEGLEGQVCTSYVECACTCSS